MCVCVCGGVYFSEPFICGRQYINLSLITAFSSRTHHQSCRCPPVDQKVRIISMIESKEIKKIQILLSKREGRGGLLYVEEGGSSA